MNIRIDETLDPARDLQLLEHIEIDPDISQASLAANLGVAIGTVNWHLKRLVAKGYVKVRREPARQIGRGLCGSFIAALSQDT